MDDFYDPYADPNFDQTTDPNQIPGGEAPQPVPGLPAKAAAGATPSRLAQMAAAMGAGRGGPGGASLPTPSAEQDPSSPLMEDEKKKYGAGAGDSSGMSGQVQSILSLLAG